MRQLRVRVNILVDLLRAGDFSAIAGKLRRGLWSETSAIGLRRDLDAPFEPRPSPVRFTVRPMEPADAAMLDGPGAGPVDEEVLALRRQWVRGGLPGAHVAVLADGTPCFLQWLLGARDNDAIRDFFGDTLPPLDADTVLLEGAYTPPRRRRIPVMPAAMAEIAGRGRDLGARWAIVFVENNDSMIRASRWAGFEPFAMKIERRRFFSRRVILTPIT